MGERDTGTRTVGAALSDSASAFSEFVPTVPVDGGHLQVTIGFLALRLSECVNCGSKPTGVDQ